MIDSHFLPFQEYCRSTLFDERSHMPESYKKLASAELVSLPVRLDTADTPAPRFSGSSRGGKSSALKTRGVCGTLPYMAPEVLRNLEYSYAVDWFSYGVFLHVFYLDKVRFCFLQ